MMKRINIARNGGVLLICYTRTQTAEAREEIGAMKGREKEKVSPTGRRQGIGDKSSRYVYGELGRRATGRFGFGLSNGL